MSPALMDPAAADAYDLSNDPRWRAKSNDPAMAIFEKEVFTPVYIVSQRPCWSEKAEATPFWGCRHMDKCPEVSIEISKEMCNFLNTKRFKAK